MHYLMFLSNGLHQHSFRIKSQHCPRNDWFKASPKRRRYFKTVMAEIHPFVAPVWGDTVSVVSACFDCVLEKSLARNKTTR